MLVKFAVACCIVSGSIFGGGVPRALAEATKYIAEALEIPRRASVGKLVDAFGKLPVSWEDAELRFKVINSLKAGFVGMPEPTSPIVFDMSRLAFQYGAGTQRHALFPYRVGNSRYVLRPLENPRIAELAARVPREHDGLADILGMELLRLGFDKPSGRDFHRMGIEEMALWVLMVRLLRGGDERMQNFARAVFAMMSDYDTDFFRAARGGPYNFFRVLFDDWLDERYIDHISSALWNAGALREGFVVRRNRSP